MSRALRCLVLGALLQSCGSDRRPEVPSVHLVGGSVTGLAGSGLVLRARVGDCAAEDLAVSAHGPFVFGTRAPRGATYAVTVAASPVSPWQACAVEHGAGTVGDGDVSVAVTCTTSRFALGGTVAGLAGQGLVLGDGLGHEVSPQADGPFAFSESVPSGASYAVTVVSQPAAPWQTCVITDGTGVVSSAAVSGVGVACETNRYALGGAVAGLSGAGLVLRDGTGQEVALATDGPFIFPAPLPSGANYAVAVASQPIAPSQTCTVTGGAGTVGTADVSGVLVTCETDSFLVGGSVSGLGGASGLVLLNAGGDPLAIDHDGAFVFATSVASGAGYDVTVSSQPPALRCAVAGGRGTVGASDVSSVSVTCSSVVQAWAAPATWGAAWPDGPTLVQHAWFDGTSLVEEKGIAWTTIGTMPAQIRRAAFGAGARWAAGPFEGPRYEAIAGSDAALDLTGDMLVCAVVEPGYNPSVPQGDGLEPVIIAKGLQAQPPGTPAQVGAGWVLMQMHDMFCFHYQYMDGSTSRTTMAYTPTYFADRNQQRTGPLNPTYVVVCAGRAGNTLITAASGYPDAAAGFPTAVTGPMEVGTVPHPLTIGGYDTGDPNHTFGGRVFETAVWAEPATPENIQARMAAVHGLPPGARYTRNREGPYDFAGAALDGGYHTAWRHAPRVDPARGLLFGLQGWNRLTYPDASLNDPSDMTIGQRNPVVATGEDLSGLASDGSSLWTRSAGAAIVRDPSVRPPGDSRQGWADHVTLAPRASISRTLETFEAAGSIHAMAWLRPGSASGPLTLRTTRPDPASGTSRAVVDLRTRAAGWSRAWLAGLTTDGGTTPATVSLSNEGTSAIDFHLWGLDLTQLGGGADLGSFDPGVPMYDWGAGDDRSMSGHGRYPVDVLELAPVPGSTAATGFCLAAEAQPPDGLAWNAPFARNRALLSWVGDGAAGAASLFVEGTAARGAAARRICFTVQGGGAACAEPPAWASGSRHVVAGCSAPSGAVRLYLDGALAASATGAATPDLATGHLLVGNAATPASYASSIPFHGFVSKALACRDTGSAPAGCR